MKLLDYIFAARPMLLLPVWSIFLVSLHYHQQLSGERFDLTDLSLMISLTLAAAGAYYLNQVCDQESDRINGKLGFLHRGILSEKELTRWYLLLSVLSVTLALAVSVPTFFVVLVLFILGYVYSAPPFRLKDRPVGGLIANATGIGFVIPLAVMPDISFHTAGLLGWDNPFYFFFAVGSIYIVTTLPDRRGDEAAAKRTLAVLLPRRMVLMIALCLMMLSAWVAWYSDYTGLLYLSLFSSAFLILTMVVNSDKYILTAAKLPIFLLTLMASGFFWGYFLFMVAILFLARIYYRKRFGITYPGLT